MTQRHLTDGGQSTQGTVPDVLSDSANVSRRRFLTLLAATGAGTILGARHLIGQSASAQGSVAPHSIIDVHHHFFPPSLLEAAENVPSTSPWRLPAGAKEWSPAKAVAELDRYGISTAVVSMSSPLYEMSTDAQLMRRIVRQCNEYATQMRKDHPGRFGLFAVMPMPDVEGSLAEIQYALDVLKADGVGFMTSYNGKYPGDKAFAPIFEELNRRKAVAYFHPYTPSCCDNLMSYVPAGVIEFPTDTSRAVLSLLFSGALAKYRDVRWIFSHGGGTIPMLAGRLNTLAKNQKNLPEIAPQGVDAELHRLHFEVANSETAPTMAAVLKYMPLSQVLFGTDYPFVTISQNIDDINKLNLPAAQLLQIESANAIRLMPELMG